MRTSFVHDPEFWRGRAIEARSAAAQMSDELSRTAMLALAARYERIAYRILRGLDIFRSAAGTHLPIENSPHLDR